MHPKHAVIARSEATKQSISFGVRDSGLLRFARNDGSAGTQHASVSVHGFVFAPLPASCLARSRTCFRSRPASMLRNTFINFRPSRIVAVLGGSGRDAASDITFGGRPLRLPFMFALDQRRERPPSPEKLLDIRRQGARQFFENRDCRILQSPFETADIGPVDPGIDGKHLLRELPRDPKPPYVSSDRRACFHPTRSSVSGRLNHAQ